MKKLITIIAALFITVSSFSQQKQDSLVLEIRIDTTTFKNIVALIQEKIPANTPSGDVIQRAILIPLYNGIKLVPRQPILSDKPKEVPLKTKP